MLIHYVLAVEIRMEELETYFRIMESMKQDRFMLMDYSLGRLVIIAPIAASGSANILIRLGSHMSYIIGLRISTTRPAIS